MGEHAVCETLPGIIRNDERLYQGDLVHYLNIIFHNAKNCFLPYHNFRHMTHITWLCHEACRYYCGTLSPRSMRDLLISAMFHDFDHTGKRGADSINIRLAILGLRRHVLPEDRPSLPAIEACIHASEYPYVIKEAKLDLCARILRDADSSQALTTAWIQQVIMGLAAEWGVKPIEVLKMQESFHRGLIFRTEWGRERFPSSMVEAKIREARELFALLDPTPLQSVAI